MYHAGDNLYFGRMNGEGDVRVLRFHNKPASSPNANGVYSKVNVAVDLVVPSTQWPNVVAQVSAHGESGDRFYKAAAFHNNV